MATTTKYTMMLDTDVGVDDAVALLMALSQPNVDLIGVTCVHGNTALDNVLVNTLRVLRVANRSDVSFVYCLVHLVDCTGCLKKVWCSKLTIF